MAVTTTTKCYKSPTGQRIWRLLIAETSIRDTTESTIVMSGSVPALPLVCRLLAFRADLTAGTGTTIKPRLGNTAGFVAGDITEITKQASAAADFNDQTNIRFYLPTEKTLYLVSAPNSTATDHSVSTELLITDDMG